MLTKFAFQTQKPKPRAIAFGLFFCHFVSIKTHLLWACLLRIFHKKFAVDCFQVEQHNLKLLILTATTYYCII